MAKYSHRVADVLLYHPDVMTGDGTLRVRWADTGEVREVQCVVKYTEGDRYAAMYRDKTKVAEINLTTRSGDPPRPGCGIYLVPGVIALFGAGVALLALSQPPQFQLSGILGGLMLVGVAFLIAMWFRSHNAAFWRYYDSILAANK